MLCAYTWVCAGRLFVCMLVHSVGWNPWGFWWGCEEGWGGRGEGCAAAPASLGPCGSSPFFLEVSPSSIGGVVGLHHLSISFEAGAGRLIGMAPWP
jgi:hypothetical protein